MNGRTIVCHCPVDVAIRPYHQSAPKATDPGGVSPFPVAIHSLRSVPSPSCPVQATAASASKEPGTIPHSPLSSMRSRAPAQRLQSQTKPTQGRCDRCLAVYVAEMRQKCGGAARAAHRRTPCWERETGTEPLATPGSKHGENCWARELLSPRCTYEAASDRKSVV